jgi:hypothetical protein
MFFSIFYDFNLLISKIKKNKIILIIFKSKIFLKNTYHYNIKHKLNIIKKENANAKRGRRQITWI